MIIGFVVTTEGSTSTVPVWGLYFVITGFVVTTEGSTSTVPVWGFIS